MLHQMRNFILFLKDGYFVNRGEENIMVIDLQDRYYDNINVKPNSNRGQSEEKAKIFFLRSGFPLGLENLENLEKWEGILQSGKGQGILIRLEKSGKITQNTGKIWEFQTNIIYYL